MMYCPNCGKEIDDNSKFCEHCGSKIQQKAEAVKDLKGKEQGGKEQERKEAVGIEGFSEGQSTQTRGGGKKMGWKILAIALVFAVIGTVGGIALYRHSAKGKTENKTANHKRETSSDTLFPTLGEDKKGFIDESGDIVIEEIFDDVTEFTEEGLAAVEKDGKWGYIDRAGKTVIEFQYDDANPFSEGCAVVMLGDKQGVINCEGESIVDFQYDEINQFQNGYAKMGVDMEHFGMLNKNGEIVIEPKYQELGDHFSPNGVIQAYSNEAGCWMLLNQKGETVKAFEPGEYEKIEDFNEVGFALSSIVVQNEGLELYGYINESGEGIVPALYQTVSGFSEQGKIVADKGLGVLAIINQQGEEEALVNVDGEVEYIQGISKQGIATIMLGDSWLEIKKAIFLTSEGQILGGEGASYSYAGMFGDNHLAPVEIDGKWGYINTQSELVIPAIYEQANEFGDKDTAYVQVEGKGGLINEKGEYVLEPLYFEVHDTSIANIKQVTEITNMPAIKLLDVVTDENGNWLYTLTAEGDFEAKTGYWNIDNGSVIGEFVKITDDMDGEKESLDYEGILDVIEDSEHSGIGAITLDELLDTYDGELSREELDNTVMASEAQLVEFEEYYNTKYTYQVTYPDIFTFTGESDSGDGTTMRSDDGQAELKIWGWYNVFSLRPEDELKDYQGQPQSAVVDWDCGDNYCAVTMDYGDIYHHSMSYYENGKAASYTMSYPKERRAYYEEFFKRMDDDMKAAFFAMSMVHE